MGGQAESTVKKQQEQVVKAKKPKKKGKKSKRLMKSLELPRIRQTQDVRMHLESRTKRVHFHVDDESLKAEVPLAQMEMDLGELRSLKSRKKLYHDSENNTLLELVVGLTDDDQIDIQSTVTACEEQPKGILSGLNDICALSKPKTSRKKT